MTSTNNNQFTTIYFFLITFVLLLHDVNTTVEVEVKSTQFDDLTQEAGRGNVESQYKLGNLLYRGGDGVPKDTSQALKWYTNAAEQGHTKAQYNLGNLLCHGAEGVPKDPLVALKWYIKAAEQGHAKAQTNLGVLLCNGVDGIPKDPREALKWYNKSAEQGHAKAQFNLGNLLRYGAEGVAHDHRAALKWWTKAAEQGHVWAQNNLGFLLHDGVEGVPKDPRTALKWWTKAAEQGHDWAQYNLGVLLHDGAEGVPKDPHTALEWWTKAAEQDHASAQLMMSQHVNDPTLREKASNDYNTVPFADTADLEHGDVILGYFWKLKWLEHWGIYDKDANKIIDLNRDTVGDVVIDAYPFREWFDKWNERGKGWLWDHPVQKVRWKDDRLRMSNSRRHAVKRARKRVGEQGIKYNVLPTFDNTQTMNCESFVRWCVTGVARSSQAERVTDSVRLSPGDGYIEQILDGRVGKMHVASVVVGSVGIGGASVVVGTTEVAGASAISSAPVLIASAFDSSDSIMGQSARGGESGGDGGQTCRGTFVPVLFPSIYPSIFGYPPQYFL